MKLRFKIIFRNFIVLILIVLVFSECKNEQKKVRNIVIIIEPNENNFIDWAGWYR